MVPQDALPDTGAILSLLGGPSGGKPSFNVVWTRLCTVVRFLACQRDESSQRSGVLGLLM